MIMINSLADQPETVPARLDGETSLGEIEVGTGV